ncbi:hypothetical protein BKA70DRAFT_1236773 [Coprinopsis sp. MPI-PUGE-AT-0042]|nr:hypothetical protein BKA70DRAFT_1236773 [Coprinopsis sp. MPI-PUGE-AT-0042]
MVKEAVALDRQTRSVVSLLILKEMSTQQDAPFCYSGREALLKTLRVVPMVMVPRNPHTQYRVLMIFERAYSSSTIHLVSCTMMPSSATYLSATTKARPENKQKDSPRTSSRWSLSTLPQPLRVCIDRRYNPPQNKPWRSFDAPSPPALTAVHSLSVRPHEIWSLVDVGKVWETSEFGVSSRSCQLASLFNSTSQRFLLRQNLGEVAFLTLRCDTRSGRQEFNSRALAPANVGDANHELAASLDVIFGGPCTSPSSASSLSSSTRSVSSEHTRLDTAQENLGSKPDWTQRILGSGKGTHTASLAEPLNNGGAAKPSLTVLARSALLEFRDAEKTEEQIAGSLQDIGAHRKFDRAKLVELGFEGLQIV